ncbi:2'-5' RNA ligase family protein [Acinetobacter beijerinckii]|uniref:2'-5' RNA ligase family protein n=1 Tax=Acinetobacter beijerinckii TaxID=262668 RepID=UPI0023DE092C|nr:2'-5' RNA ligase family protein [Acinetobacter beijerinckii]MDF2416568.1 2'-5' RNA ligase family protein [Acinetobacter beijerinckii]
MLLQTSTQLVKTEIRDYPEWHHGRTNYALWYIEIDQPELVEYLDAIKTHFSDFLLTSNQRQYHITLFVCGFPNTHLSPYNDDFSAEQLSLHLKSINQLQLEPFELELTAIDSFSSALFIQIIDQEKNLEKIRSQLAVVSNEIAALQYCPHITIGLYSDAWSSDLVLERIKSFEAKRIKIQVNQLTFGYYKAQILQGLLYPYHQMVLG